MFGIIDSVIKPKTERPPNFVSAEECCKILADCCSNKTKHYLNKKHSLI